MSKDPLRGKKTLNVSGFLDEFEKDDIKKKVDIVALFAHYGIHAEKKGSTYKAKCHWHSEKTPSLTLYPEKGDYFCFGCQKSGDMFNLVQEMEGVDFKESLKFLKKFAGASTGAAVSQPNSASESPPDCPETVNTVLPSKSREVPAEPEPFESHQPEGGSSETKAIQISVDLDKVMDFYRKSLSSSREGLSYFETRGIEGSVLSRFGCGYSEGIMKNLISSGQKKALQEIGIFNEKGYETFRDCVIIPFLDSAGKTVGLYGRKISSSAKVNHLYLKGPHRGLLNRKAASVYREEIILTESVIDALSLIQLGIENVIPCYGTGGFTSDHLSLLKEERVKVVVIAFDNDDAGRNAAQKLIERLVEEGFSVKLVYPPRGKDWNELLTLGSSADEIKELIESAEITYPQTENPDFKAQKEGDRYLFAIKEMEYRLLGVKDLFVSTLRVNIKIEFGGKRDYDSVDLYSSRSRKTFSDRMGGRLDVDSVRIEKDLLDILEYLEEERDKKLNPSSTGEDENMSEEERDAGMSLLTDADLYGQVVRDVNELGYVSTESQNILIVYIAALSRFFPEPLSVFVRGSSSGGKTALVKTVTRLVPDSDKWGAHDMSDQSLHYVDDDKLNGKVVLMGEDLHDEKIEGKIRQMQSDHELTKLVTVKDEESGQMRAQHIVKNVRLSFMITSTTLSVNLENISRCLILSVDETAEQTEKVHRKTGEKHLCVGMNTEVEKDRQRRILRKHHLAQRLLQPVVIFNPFGLLTKFPSASAEMRRAFDYFLYFIDAVCFGRQMQKNFFRLTIPGSGKKEVVKKCDLEDYKLGYSLYVEGILRKNLMVDVSSSTRNLYEAIRGMVKDLAKEKKLDIDEVVFTQKMIRERTRFKHEFVKKHIRILTGYEYVSYAGGGGGKRHSYRLTEDLAMEELDISMVTSPEQMAPLLEEYERTALKDQEDLGRVL